MTEVTLLPLVDRFFELRVKLFCKDGKEMGEAGCGNGTEDNEGSFYGLDITATRNNPAYIFVSSTFDQSRQEIFEKSSLHCRVKCWGLEAFHL